MCTALHRSHTGRNVLASWPAVPGPGLLPCGVACALGGAGQLPGLSLSMPWQAAPSRCQCPWGRSTTSEGATGHRAGWRGPSVPAVGLCLTCLAAVSPVEGLMVPQALFQCAGWAGTCMVRVGMDQPGNCCTTGRQMPALTGATKSLTQVIDVELEVRLRASSCLGGCSPT
jgi:hypothetical protein